MYRPSCPVMPVMRARFMSMCLRRKASRLAAAAAPLGVELAEELRATLLLVVLADRGGAGAQAVQGAQETLVGRVTPPDVARAAPPGLAQPVEPAVVTHPEVGVRLDVVASQLPEPRPSVEEAGPADRKSTRLNSSHLGR